MKIRTLNPSKLKKAKYNPPARTSDRALRSLKDSVKLHGVLVPVLVDKDFNIIDGHRRAHCAAQLGINVPVLIIESSLSTDEQFNNINTTARRISQGDMLFIYLNGGIVSKKTKDKISEIESIIGATNLKMLADNYVSPAILNRATTVAKYCLDKNNKQFIGKIIMWMVNNKMANYATEAIKNGIKRDLLVSAIENNKPLKQTWIA